MKKISKLNVVFLVLLTMCAVIGIHSCGAPSENPRQSEFTPVKTEIWSPNQDYTIVIIDSCEYIKHSIGGHSRGYGYFSHKGDCKNHQETDYTLELEGDQILVSTDYGEEYWIHPDSLEEFIEKDNL